MKKIAMIGVGKLGQDCAEVMSDAGNDVVGYDIEPRNPAFPMTSSVAEAVKDRDLIFIAAPTPHDPIYGGETPTSHLPNKDFDYTIVKGILEEVNKHVNKNQLVVLISTVLPGTIRSLLYPCITNARFIYNPYLIAMGTIKWDMVNPEMVIIGTEDGSITGDAHELIEFYKSFMENDPRYEVGTWDEAESIKIFYNTFISTKIALVNMIQDVAETNGNINVDIVTNALAKSTHRIMGPAYMKAGLGDAGACHPRDNIALRYLAEKLDLGYDLFDSIMTAREKQAERMALKCLEYGNNVTIVGKAYKPGVHYTNGSASMLVGHYVEKHNGNVHYYDLNTGDTDLKSDWSDVYLIGYWENWVEDIKFPEGSIVIDPWRNLLEKTHDGELIRYGDTRKKNSFKVPDYIKDYQIQQIYLMLPELQEFENDIHYVYAAATPEYHFFHRPTMDIVEEIREAIQLGKSKFIFFSIDEGFLTLNARKIHRILKLLDKEIDPKNVTYLSGCINVSEVYPKFVTDNNIENPINVLSTNYLELFLQERYKKYKGLLNVDHTKTKEKLFLCFNRKPHDHRIYLLEKMLENNLVDKGYYSFQAGPDFYNEIVEHAEKFPEIVKNIDRFPLVLNITPERFNPIDIRPEDVIYFENSYFSIVTETLCFSNENTMWSSNISEDNSVFFSEKIYKCCLMKHPFIVLSNPGYLKWFREMGYKTFSPFIDESYDTVENDFERLTMVINEIKRLCSFTKDQWDDFLRHIAHSVEHNYNHFLSGVTYE